MRDIGRVFANEWMKLLRRRRFWVTAVLSLFVVALFGLVTYHDHENEIRYNNPVVSTQHEMEYFQQEITQLESQPQSAARDQQLEQFKEQLQNSKEQLKRLQSHDPNAWRADAKDQMAGNNQQIQKLESSSTRDGMTNAQLAGAQSTNEMWQYRLDHNVAPLTWPTMNAYDSLEHFLDLAAKIFLPLLVVILVADMVSGELTDGTIKLLLVRPVSRVKILIGKWLVSLTATAIWAAAVCLALFGAAVAILGVRGGTQPIFANVTYTFEPFTQATPDGVNQGILPVPHYGHALLLPQWQFLVYAFLLTVLSMLAVATITFLCSTIFKSAMVSTAAAMGSVIIGFILMNIARHESFVKWLFPTHLNLTGNWTGDLAQTLNQPVTITYGVVVLVIWAVIAVAISLYQFKRRDVLNA